MARKIDDHGNRIPYKECPKHGEFLADAPDSVCPACDDAPEPHDLECGRCGITLNNQCLDPDCEEDENHRSPTATCEECFTQTRKEIRNYFCATEEED